MIAFVFIVLFLGAVFADNPIVDEETDKSLREEVTWHVASNKKNIFRNKNVEDLGQFMGVEKPAENERRRRPKTRRVLDAVPSSFDARDKWPECIHSVRDQGSCGGCWAFGVTNHLTDRFCTMKGVDVTLSPQDLLECDGYDKCCKGGSPTRAYKFLAERGIVKDSCKQYTQTCNSCRAITKASCKKYYKCEADSGWDLDVDEAKSEIYTNGPVMAIFSVYKDFFSYESGVYYHKTGVKAGDHAVELLGWGREAGLDYWLVKNSWGADWGDSGYFKIKMGDCEINDYISTCTPQAPDS